LESRSQKDLGIAGIIAAVLVIKGAAWAFATGIILTALIYGRDFFSRPLAQVSGRNPFHDTLPKQTTNSKNNQHYEDQSRRTPSDEIK
jgi:hypothetical protein